MPSCRVARKCVRNNCPNSRHVIPAQAGMTKMAAGIEIRKLIQIRFHDTQRVE